MLCEAAAPKAPDNRFNGQLSGRRLIFVLGWLDLGGAERQAIETARYLRDREDADTVVWGFSTPGGAVSLCDKYGIPWKYHPFTWGGSRVQRVFALFRLAMALRAERPDVLLPYCTPPNIACGLIWRLAGARGCVWNQRGEGGLVGSRWERWAFRRSPVVVSNTRVHADMLVQRYGVCPSRVHVIPNGVTRAHPTATRSEMRQRLGISEEAFVACMVARVHECKDHLTLVRAWGVVVEQLRAEGRQGVLLLAGRADRADRVKAVAVDLNLGRTVRFLGIVKDIPNLLQAVDLCVYSSRVEGCPNGVLECMAAGLPVVGTDIEGIREAVGPANYPYLTPQGDDRAMADQIVRMACDAESRSQIGRANRQRIVKEFSMEGLGPRMVGLLRLCCPLPGGRP